MSKHIPNPFGSYSNQGPLPLRLTMPIAVAKIEYEIVDAENDRLMLSTWAIGDTYEHAVENWQQSHPHITPVTLTCLTCPRRKPEPMHVMPWRMRLLSGTR